MRTMPLSSLSRVWKLWTSVPSSRVLEWALRFQGMIVGALGRVQEAEVIFADAAASSETPGEEAFDAVKTAEVAKGTVHGVGERLVHHRGNRIR